MDRHGPSVFPVFFRSQLPLPFALASIGLRLPFDRKVFRVRTRGQKGSRDPLRLARASTHAAPRIARHRRSFPPLEAPRASHDPRRPPRARARRIATPKAPLASLEKKRSTWDVGSHHVSDAMRMRMPTWTMADGRTWWQRCAPLAIATVVLVVAMMLAHEETYGGSEVRRGEQGEGAVVFRRASPWRALFREAEVAVTCGAAMSRVRVYVGDSETNLEDKVARNRWTWCGLYRRNATCRVRVDPTRDVHVLLKKMRAKDECVVELTWERSAKLVALFGVGLIFLSFGSLLSQSKRFRLGAGATTVALASALLLLYVVHSRVPKGRIAASIALLGTSVSGICRLFYGAWIPQYDEDLIWKAVAIYLLLGFLAGLALTHVFDDERNERVIDVLKGALKIIGGIFVAFSLRPWWMAACAFALVALQKVYMWWQNRYGAQTATGGMQENEQLFLPTAGDQEQEEPRTPTQQQESTSEDFISPLVKKGFITNMSTMRVIKIEGNTYNRLLARGYTPDRVGGYMTPPKDTPGTARNSRRSSLASPSSS